MLAFHKKWYSANIMCLALTSNHSLESMEKWVSEKFDPIVNKDVEIPDLVSPHPFPKESLQKLVRYVPVKDEHKISFYWVLPYYQKDIKGKPLNYFSHLVGHEGQNSLLSYLKEHDLALELSAGPDHELYGYSSMEVEVKLTKKGLDNYEKVIEATFQYLKTINEAGPQDYVFNEVNDLGKVSFEFADKGKPMNTCVALSG